MERRSYYVIMHFHSAQTGPELSEGTEHVRPTLPSVLGTTWGGG